MVWPQVCEQYRSRYVTLPWSQNFWISTNCGPPNMAEKKKKWTCMNFLSMTPLIAHTFLPSFDNATGHLCQEILLKSRNFATMVTWRHTFLFISPFQLFIRVVQNRLAGEQETHCKWPAAKGLMDAKNRFPQKASLDPSAYASDTSFVRGSYA